MGTRARVVTGRPIVCQKRVDGDGKREKGEEFCFFFFIPIRGDIQVAAAMATSRSTTVTATDGLCQVEADRLVEQVTCVVPYDD